jgi:GNAT superfamily N-acetyltransferase
MSRRLPDIAGGLVLSQEREPDESTVRALKSGVDAYNLAAAGPDNYEPVWIIARDDAGRVQGGLYGHTSWGWLFIDWLWIDEKYRGQGLGSKLLRAAEAIARERGCEGVYLNTYTYQAPGFYERQGYSEFGRLEGMPPGHARVWFKKSLRQPDESVR